MKMILIQDGSQPPNVDKPLRIIGDPYKVQVLLRPSGDHLGVVTVQVNESTHCFSFCPIASKRNGE